MITPPIRKQDKHGAGYYLAPRGQRLHNGVDLACFPGSTVTCPFETCTVERIGRPYSPAGPKKEYQLIELKIDAQTKAKIMYISPAVNPGDKLSKGDKMGIVQDLGKIYPGITPHIHLEIWIEGDHVDPIQWLENNG